MEDACIGGKYAWENVFVLTERFDVIAKYKFFQRVSAHM